MGYEEYQYQMLSNVRHQNDKLNQPAVLQEKIEIS